MENVPALKRVRHGAYVDFVEGLLRAGYGVQEHLQCADYGVPQTRERLLILAGADRANIHMIAPAVCSLPPSEQQSAPAADHCWCTKLHSTTCCISHLAESDELETHTATPEGGSWKDWPWHFG